MRTINADGLAHLKQWEKLRLVSYDDRTGQPVPPGGRARGKLTIGYGHTGPDVFPGMTITQELADDLLRRDLAWAEDAVNRLVKVPLTDGQFAALVSFVYNVGEAAFARSTLLRKLNAGEYASVPGQLARWNKDQDDSGKLVVVDGLVNRRAAEIGLWAKGSFVTSAGDAHPKPETPPLLTRENVTTAAAAVGAMGAVATGSGPVQYAFAAVIVVAVLVGGFLILRKRLWPS